MPVFGNIIINDGQATPVAHTFIPIAIENGVAIWQDQTGGVPLGYSTITWVPKRPASQPRAGLQSSSDRVTRQKLTVSTSTMTTLGTTDAGLTPPPTISHVHRAVMEFVQPERGSLQERKDLTAYCQNLLGHATVKSLLNDQEGLRGA